MVELPSTNILSQTPLNPAPGILLANLGAGLINCSFRHSTACSASVKSMVCEEYGLCGWMAVYTSQAMHFQHECIC